MWARVSAYFTKEIPKVMHTDSNPSSSIRLLFLGDVMLGRLVDKIFPTHIPDVEERYLAFALLQRDPMRVKQLKELGHKYVWSDTLPLFDKADLRLINLETSVTTHPEKWPNKAFNYQMHPANLKCLQEAKIDYCSLANNHVLDFRLQGMYDTMKALNDVSIKWAGVGKNKDEAMTPATLDWKGKKIGVYSFSDHYSYWAADATRPGINFIDVDHHTPHDIAMIKQRIQKDREQKMFDLVVVSIHWGPNYAWHPAKSFKAFAHSLIDDCYVDIIHGHSSHHVQGIEIYRNKPILYGCGDFIDDYAVDPEYRNNLGFMYFLNMNFEHKSVEKIELIPTKIENLCVTKTLPKSDENWLFSTMQQLCKPLGTTLSRTSEGSFLVNKLDTATSH